jgi:hypothetical protein
MPRTITDNRILRLPFASELDYNDLMKVDHLLSRGAQTGLIYFWFNVTHGHYRHLKPESLQRDREVFKEHYPNFSTDIDLWQPRS